MSNTDETSTDMEAAERAALIDELEGLSLGELMKRGQRRLIIELIADLEAGTLSHQKAAILRNVLRDNGLTMPPKDPEVERRDAARPRADLPDYDEPEYAGHA